MRWLVCLAALIMLAPAARAAEPSVLRQLMAEPMTLFDWGLTQLDRDIALAAKRSLRYRARSEPRTGSIYDWRNDRVTVFVTTVVPPQERTRQMCTAAFTDIVGTLTETAPQGPDAAGWYLLNAFLPKGHYWANRFEDVGRKLLDMVELEITLSAEALDTVGGDTARVRCSGRLDAATDEIATEVTS